MKNLARNIDALSNVKICSKCFFIHMNTGALCDICANTARRHDIIMIVEKETDLMSLENTGKFVGRYFIIGSIPKTGILEEWQKLRLESLKNFIKKELGSSTNFPRQNSAQSGSAEEIILAFNPTSVGDFNTSLISRELSGLTKKISRLGRGLPTGGEIEFADEETLGSALERRD
jgi:recombination protein RecR